MSDYKEFILKQREAQAKWDYFLISISLAFLVITYQAFNINESVGFEYLAVISWLSMITSALIGLYRRRLMYSFMAIEADNIKETERGTKTKAFTELYENITNKEQKRIALTNYIQLILFGLGIFVYILFICSSIYPAFFDFIRLM